MDRNLPCPFLVEFASNFDIIPDAPASKGKAQQRTSESIHPKKSSDSAYVWYQKIKKTPYN